MKNTCVLAAILCLGPAAGLACSRIDGLATYCETREITAPFTGNLNVDSSPIGSITVKGWDDPGVLIRAQISASAPDEFQATALAAQVSVTDSAGVVRASGPLETNHRQWSVSYEIYLPRAAGVSLKAGVGAISIHEVTGQIRCATNVGALKLVSLNGDVACQSSVGAVLIALAGDHWDGPGLVVQTNVGAIDLSFPGNYSAHLELSTGLGTVTSNIPLPVVKDGFGRSLSTDIGGGGATIRISTGVGAIKVE